MKKNNPIETVHAQIKVEHVKSGKIGNLKRISGQMGQKYYMVEYPDRTADLLPADEFVNVLNNV